MKKLMLLLTITILIVSMTNCSNKKSDIKNKTINFGYVQWPGATVKTEVVKQIADLLGYETKTITGSQQVLFKGMETNDIDCFLALWMPSMKSNIAPYKEKGAVEIVTDNLKNCNYIAAVNKEAWDAGVKTFADLKEHSDKFENQFFALEPGNDGNNILKNKIIPSYNLNDWKVTDSSTGGMLATVKSRTQKDKWVAFLGWQPHYMNIMFDIKYLKDPKDVWPGGGVSTVYTLARKGFKNDNPNFYRFLENFKLDTKTQSKWIYDYKKGGPNKKGITPEKVAEKWISNNLDTIEKWLQDVNSADGKNGFETLKSNISK